MINLVIELISYTKLIILTYLPRSLRETRSVKTRKLIIIRVPIPAPCTERPKRSNTIL